MASGDVPVEVVGHHDTVGGDVGQVLPAGETQRDLLGHVEPRLVEVTACHHIQTYPHSLPIARGTTPA
jgi:hypothetical protein